MKRALEESVTEIVRVAQERNEEGAFVHPELHSDLFLITIFHAPEALLEVLVNSPILFLQVLQANKQLSVFWSQFKGIWILLYERLIEMERDKYFSEVYPYWCIENHRIWERQKVFGTGEAYRRPFFEANPPSCLEPTPSYIIFIGNAIAVRQPGSQIVYFEKGTVTQKWMSLIQNVSDWERYAPLSLVNDDLLFFEARKMLKGYLRGLGLLGSLVLYTDSFLVSPGTTFSYNVAGIKSNLPFIKSLFFKNTYNYDERLLAKPGTAKIKVTRRDLIFGGTRAEMMPRAAVLLLDNIRKSIGELELIIANPTLQEEIPIFTELNKANVKRYRDEYFQTIHNTPEKQKQLFFSLLNELASYNDNAGKERLIEEYGSQVPFRCALCKTETLSVDPVRLEAFCTEGCRTHYCQ